MKQLKLVLALFCLIQLMSCTDEVIEDSKPSTSFSETVDDISIQDIEIDPSELGTEKSDCDETIYGSFSGLGYYFYPERTLDLACLSNGYTVNIPVYALEVPNRFAVYQNGILLVSSGWIGYSSIPGPWGSSLNGPDKANLSFTYSSGSTYTLRVETVTNGKRVDEWYANVKCTCSSNPPLCTNDCGENWYGQYTSPGFYVYPDEAIDLSCVGTGCNISLTVDALEVPNRFAIYKDGLLLVSSGWIGWSSIPGPWGPSLNGPSTATLSFSYQGGSTYALRVETVAPNDRADEWSVYIDCEENCGGD